MNAVLVSPDLPAQSPAASRNLASNIERQILKIISWQVSDFKVEFDGDVVVLKGRCSTYFAKKSAQDATMDLIKGRTLTNQIEVKKRTEHGPVR